MPYFDDDEDEYEESDWVTCIVCGTRDSEDEMRLGWNGEEWFCYSDACANTCNRCDRGYMTDITDNTYDCPGCRTSNVSTDCGNCSRSASEMMESFIMADGTRWCRGCTTAASSRCGQCYTRHPRANNAIINVQGGRTYCTSCGTRYVWQCTCLEYVARNAYCTTCFRRENGEVFRCGCGQGTSDRPIHSSSCRPRLVFHGESAHNLFFGIELETALPSDVEKAAQFVRTELQLSEIAQSKYDGSIGNGFEIVTQPTTFDHYMNESDVLWGVIDTLRVKYKARSWDAGTCGLHIHISRAGFSDTGHTHRFIEFIYRNAEMMMKFAGRKSSYAKFNDCWRADLYDKPVFSIEHKMPTTSRLRTGGDRYTAVNTNNESTLELRFMRGTMNVDGVKSGISLAHAMVEYTRHLAEDKEGKWHSWDSFDEFVTAHASIYPQLVARMPEIKSVDINSKIKIDA